MGVLESLGGWHIEAEHQVVHALIDAGTPESAGAEQRRGRVKLFEETTDGERFREHGAVIQHECRDIADRVDGEKLGAAMFVLREIQVDEFECQAFFRGEHAHASRAGSESVAIQLHCKVS